MGQMNSRPAGAEHGPTPKTSSGGLPMRNDHVADAKHPGQTALQQWLYGAKPGNLPVLKSRPEAIRNYLPERHGHYGRNVNRPESNATDHLGPSRKRCPDWRRRNRKLLYSSKRCVHSERRRRSWSGCRRSQELRQAASPASSRRSRVATAYATSGLSAVRQADDLSVNGSRRPNQL